MIFLWLFLGLILLIAGAEVLVRSSVRLAGFFGVPSVVVGLTVVAYGTSAPELVFSFQSALVGRADFAAANVIGSNVFNVLLILGVSALLVPLKVHQDLLRKDVPILILLSLGVWGLVFNGTFGALEGWVFLLGLIAYTALAVILGERDPEEFQEEYRRTFEATGGYLDEYGNNPLLLGVGISAGIVLLLLGSTWFSGAAAELARHWGVSEWVIGATIVAMGTSLPEIVTSLVATLRGQDDVAVANVIGSNIFNLLGILGGSAVLAGGLPIADAVIGFDLPFMVVAALVCLPFFLTGFRLSRFEGFVLVVYFGFYVFLLFNPSVLGAFSASLRMSLVLGPLVLVTAGIFLRRMVSGFNDGVE